MDSGQERKGVPSCSAAAADGTATEGEEKAVESEITVPAVEAAGSVEEGEQQQEERDRSSLSERELQQVPEARDLHSALLLERSLRVRAQQQVEAEKQTCLELSRLLDLVREKAEKKRNQQGRRPSAISDLVAARRRDSQTAVSVSFEAAPAAIHAEKDTKEPEVKTPLASEEAAQRKDNVGHLSAQLLFDNFSLGVFGQLPRDLQEMLRVGGEEEEEDYDEGQPPSVLSLAYRAVCCDNPRQLKLHLAVIGEAILQSVEGAGLLGEACECGSDGCVRVLLDSGCLPNSSSRADGMSAIHLAAQNDHACCISLLLKWGGNPDVSDNDGQTALFISLCEGYRECVDILIDAGSSLKIVTKMEYTVLHAAVSGNMADVLRRLLVSLRTTQDPNSASYIINYQDKDGNTALHLAASRGYQQCVEVLCGCPQTILTVRDRWNRTALDISTADCRDILMSKDSKEVVVCVQARLPDTRQATPIAVGRATVLRHYKCLDAELLAAQTLEQFCHSLKGHIPIPSVLNSNMESDHSQLSNHEASSAESERNNIKNEDHVEWAEPCTPKTWPEHLQREINPKSKKIGSPRATETDPSLGNLKFLWGAQREMARMDLGGSSISSYRVGPLNWAPGELGKQQRGRSLHGMVGDRKGGGLGWISGGKPTEIHITLKGHSEGCLDQLAFELMIPKATLHHYVSMVMRNKAVVFHGPQGCGKTYLTKSIAEFLKHKLGPTNTQVLYISLHQSFKRDDLFRMLRLNGLLKCVSDGTGSDGQTYSDQNPHIVILDDLDRIAGYTTPSVLAELLTMMNYRGPLNPTWVDTVHSREGGVLYPAGLCYLKNSAYFIATRTQARGEALPAAVMDQFSHIALSRHEEPCSGVLYRQLVGRLIHTRHGDTPHRWDKVYRCVSWVWELWQLYNNYMKQLDLTELSLGLKHMLQCPVESGSSDSIQSWLCQLWEHHVVPRVEETLLHSRRMEGQHHQQTVNLLLRAMINRAIRPTCPLDIAAASSLLECLYPLTPSSSIPPSLTSSSLTSPSLRRRHGSQGNGSLQSSFTSPVHSVGSVPDIRHGNMKSSDYGTPGLESPKNFPGSHKGITSSDTETTSLDRMTLKKSSSRKNTLRRLRSRTISLFSKESLDLGREGRGEGAGEIHDAELRKPGKTKETGSTLPRIFKKTKVRPPLPVLSEQSKSPTSPKPERSQDLEDFFDLLSSASSNRFDDQRSPAPKPLSESGTKQPNSTPTPASELICDPLGFHLDKVPPPLMMSMPDLLSDDESDTQSQYHSIDPLYSTTDEIQTQSKPRSHTHNYVPLPPSPMTHERPRAVTLDHPSSEPLRRRMIQRAGNVVGEELNGSPSPHRASPLATTTYVYNPSVWRQSVDGGKLDEVCPEKKALNLEEVEEEGDKKLNMERHSPDGKHPAVVQVGDVSLPQRTFPDGAAARGHQRVRVSPSDPGQHSQRDCFSRGEEGEVREGWREMPEKRYNPRSHSSLGTSSPMNPPLGNGNLRPRRVLSEGDRCQSLDQVMEMEEMRSSHILFGAGLGFLSPHSPVVRGVPTRGQSFSGGSPKLNTRKRPPIREHHEM